MKKAGTRTASPMLCFLDSNIPMYAAGTDHPYREPCQRVLRLSARGVLAAVTSAEVLQEILHRYLALRRPAEAVAITQDLIVICGCILPVTLDDIERALELVGSQPHIPARDLLHVAVMQSNGISHIISADVHFDGLPGITRLDPADIAIWLPTVKQ